ncbi:hypothetical protein B0F90DRAFT_729839 [Multifurca ochricompacta]|uniref:DUF6534 domain-containing protein n=1 Tax=Multifurca ochricompacta TaxID=376703 RepID=A0AAD4MBX9_9AGAM|nr:hypothetical protein B0F90DRAFT_729839 [Multifurca ochricompacta]
MSAFASLSLIITSCRDSHTKQILKKNLYIIIPLAFLLIGEVIISVWVTVRLVLLTSHALQSHRFWPPFPLCNLFPTFLNIILSSILLHFLTQSRRRVYTEQTRQSIAHLMTVVWQSAVPPTVCHVVLFITYIISHQLYPHKRQMWHSALQGMIGKLYVLSLFYNLNTRTLFVSEQEERQTTCLSSLTVPVLDGTTTTSLNEVHSHTHHVRLNNDEISV